MRCLELQGEPGLQNLTFVDRPDPIAGPGEVVVRVRAAAINRRDVGIVDGSARNAAAYPPPLTPLSDAAGEVVDVGAGVRRWRVGDRVVARFFPHWLDGEPSPDAMGGVMGSGRQGAAQPFITLPEHALSPTPGNLDDRNAAALPCAALTAWRALIVECRVSPGDTVLVQGTGGVALFALKFAKMAGARVLLTSSSDEKLRRAREMGADLTLNYRSFPDWGAATLELTGGRGVDHLVEVGGGTFAQSLIATRFGGKIAIVGRLSGDGAATPVSGTYTKNLKLFGVTVGNRRQFEDMARAIEANGLEAPLGRVFPFEAAREAFEAMSSPDLFGKIVLDLP